MEENKLLMVFIKNPVKGRVKTRLAKSIGENEALEIYNMMLGYIEKIVSETTDCDKAVFYSDYINQKDLWNNSNYQKFLQAGLDLGERMSNAFGDAFNKNYNKVIVIGSDCVSVTSTILIETFNALDNNDVVIGPAKDGGYYLLAMNLFHKELFINIPWSTENVLLDTIIVINKLGLTYKLLPIFSDVDTEQDLKELDKLKALKK